MKQVWLNCLGIPIYFLGFVPFSGPIYHPLKEWFDMYEHDLLGPCQAVSCQLCDLKKKS